MTTPRSERGARDPRRAARATPRRPARAADAPAAAPPLDPAHADRAAAALWATLALLAAARAGLAFAPGMHAWGLNALRFEPAALGWPLWALAALALVPPAARLVTPWLERAGDAVAHRPYAAGAALAAAVAVLVGLMADHLWLIGDFLLRLGCTKGQLPPNIVFPQALPLDLWIHHHLPVALSGQGLSDPNRWERMLGAFEAALLALLAVRFARGLGLTGVAAAGCAAAVSLTGLLSMFTGYGKGFVELTLLTVAAGTFAVGVARNGRGAWPLALVTIVALGFHRSALALFAPLAAAAWVWRGAHAARAGASRAATLAAFVAPVVAAAIFAPRIIAAIRVIDAKHLAPAGGGPGAILAAAFAPGHLREIANLTIESAPLVLAAPVLALALGPALAARRREWTVLGAMAGTALLMLLFVHPQQGLFRDRDVFAPSFAALALASGALVGDALRGSQARRWIGASVVIGALVLTVQQLALQSNVSAGLARVKAYLAEAPRRPDDERALLWTFLAERTAGLNRHDEASAAYARAADLAPSPRILAEWALAEEDRGDFRAAQKVFQRLVLRADTFTDGWIGLADASLQIGDLAEARRAAERARALEPGRPEPGALLHVIAREESTRARP
jgi:tetratricopeptide (TPR) repeat protein